MSIDMTLQKWAIFIMGVYGIFFLSFVGSSWNLVSSYIKKRWHTSWKFQLEITSNKKLIAKKPLTNLYEMNSNIILIHSAPVKLSLYKTFFTRNSLFLENLMVWQFVRFVSSNGHSHVLQFGWMRNNKNE